MTDLEALLDQAERTVGDVLAKIFNSQCPSTFSKESHYTEDYRKLVTTRKDAHALLPHDVVEGLLVAGSAGQLQAVVIRTCTLQMCCP